MSFSKGSCETYNGATFNAAFNSLYQQAVAEGISVFVSSGDSGSTSCAQLYGQYNDGIGINAWAATQYNVAVGGTDFSDTYSKTNTQYWNPTSSATWASAKSYVPEFTWNDTCASSELAQKYSGSSITYGKTGFCNRRADSEFLQFGGGSGGPSGCFSGAPAFAFDYVVGGTCKGYPKPSWQQGTRGNPADGVRDIPDVSMFAGAGLWKHYYLLCFTDASNGGGPCTSNPADWPPGGGGTSFAAPFMAGVQALVDQKMGARQGNPLPILYKLAAIQFGGPGKAACNASLA
jgi:subtilase family serine protease